MIAAVYKAGCKLSIGDGCPDIKLLSGIEAVKSLSSTGAVGAGAGSVSSAVSETVASGEYASFGSTGADFALGEGVSSGVTGSVCVSSGTTNPPPKAAVFIKPYPQARIFERVEWSAPVAEYIGVDIDSYSILTMRNLVKLEKKTASQLKEIKKTAAKNGIPFAVKGVFTREDVELMQEVRPDVIVISNHGGRVENRAGSSAVFMAENAATLRKYCEQLWVDGGLRKYRDLQTAAYFGISQVMIGRPFISALCRGGSTEVRLAYENLINPTP
ncbi:MAG: alpha-hydroxy-acid oxidizing protein [Treponemataceae bacterium]|nr:alpha-hydroxy-acid oxidizing protein [Treponemataceae bacterium]